MSRKVLRVDVGKGDLEFEDLPEDYRSLVGRVLISQIIVDEVPTRHNQVFELPDEELDKVLTD